MKIEIIRAGERDGYTYRISRPGCAGLEGDEYATLAELFTDILMDAAALARIAAMVRDEERAHGV